MERDSTLDPNYSYSTKELAFLWNLSDETLRRIFLKEPGVMNFRDQKAGKRIYTFTSPDFPIPEEEEEVKAYNPFLNFAENSHKPTTPRPSTRFGMSAVRNDPNGFVKKKMAPTNLSTARPVSTFKPALTPA